MRNKLRVEALQIIELVFNSDTFQSHQDQALTSSPRRPRRILKGAGVPLGAGLSRWAVGSKAGHAPGREGT